MKVRNKGFQDKLNNEKQKGVCRGGYTLVELIVVIVIVLILATGAVLGIRTWMEWTKFKKQNEYAQTLYMAAQNQLTEYSVHGRLEPQVQDYISDGTGGYKNEMDFTSLKLIDSKGELITVDSIWPSREGKTSGTEGKYTGEVCYVMGTAKTYALYQQDADKLEADYGSEVRMLYDLLTPYLYDDSILDAAVCLEFSPGDGQVYSVLYSGIKTNKDYTFTYEHTETTRGAVSIHSRQADYRQDRMVGYYGVGTLSKATTAKAQKPSITDVKLNNGETLNLSFRLNKIKEAINELTYTITLYDSDTNVKRMEIILDGTQLSDADIAAQPKRIECTVVRYASNGTKLDLHAGEAVYGRTYPFLVKQQANNTVTIVLDALDLSASGYHYSAVKSELEADGELYAASDAGKYADTYSFTRFGIDVDNIFCTVQGAGSVYKSTAKKQSNSSHVYFAGNTSVKEADAEGIRITNTYGIANARHLNNIRYFEEKPADAGTGAGTTVYNNYQVSQSMAWNTFIEKEGLYDTADLYGEAASADAAREQALTNERTAFPSLPVLDVHSVLTSSGSRAYTLKGFVFDETANAAASVYGTAEAEDHTRYAVQHGATGLFVTNKGTIRNLVLDQVRAAGTDSVGAFCGVNEGALEQLTVLNSNSGDALYESVVSGKTNVGGITGSIKADTAQETTYAYRELENRARVYGTEYIGGIVGQLSLPAGAKCKIVVEDCANYGIVEAAAVISEADLGNETLVEAALLTRDAARYIGGITGYCENKTADEDNLKLIGCSSTPYYTDIAEITENEAALQCRLNGVYVGGIVGCNKNGRIESCTTESKSRTDGYIFGYRYVGGIAGFQEGSASGLDGADSTGKKGISGANVIGYEYVGGIVGINESNTVANWTNKGIVIAAGSYAGGITGYNQARIENCSCEVTVDTLEKNLIEAECLKGDYIGGIAGSNSGSIGADSVVSIVSYVNGGNYIGGIVGYNETDAVIHNYHLTGGTINGEAFVGGFAGLNASESLLRDTSVLSNPNLVRGDYCVGGIIGANMTALGQDVTARLKTDNFLGYVNAKAVAGGFIGYNFLMNDAAQVKEASRTLLDLFRQQDVYETLASTLPLSEQQNVYQWLVAQLAQFEAGSYESSAYRLTIAGTEDESAGKTGQMRFGGITADIYVGGIIGCNEAQTALTVRNIDNRTPVTANQAVVYEEENQKLPANAYSYAGGIIGKVTKYAVIDGCGNRDEGDVTSAGTYFGGICEINEGQILNCRVLNAGNSDRDYVGGITGMNKENGLISDCIFANATLTGSGYVGGIAVDNFGEIHGTQIGNASINAHGIGYVGGVAARNHSSGSITGKEEQIRISIDADGSFVGGIAGLNEGTLESASVYGSVFGGQFVGGIVGYNCPEDNKAMQSFVNAAAVTASDGYAGGIAGASTTDILNCANTAEISALTGDAGGITADNDAVINGCANVGAVLATNGISGGISAVNNGTISACTVGSDDGQTLAFLGKSTIGGICGINYGTIADSGVYNLRLENTASAAGGSMGSIAGDNISLTTETTAAIVNCAVGSDRKSVELKSYAAPVNIGGVAGRNTGLIDGERTDAADGSSYQDVYANLSFVQQDMAYFGNMGGVAGNNSGTIRAYSFNGEVLGTANDPALAPQYNPNRDYETNGALIYGYGGIAGVNTGSIDGCRISHARILGIGDANNIANIGGAVGFNDVGAEISNISFGAKKEYKASNTMSGSAGYAAEVSAAEAAVYVGSGSSTSAYLHAGGVCGLNAGVVTDVYPRDRSTLASTYSAGLADYTEADSSSVIVESYRGHAGGIVGHNRRTGVVSDVTTGKDWLVYAPQNAQDNGCGGVIGYNASQMGLYNCVNRAAVIKTADSSNGVGGIVGRLECSTSTTWEYTYCTNYGNIYGYERVSGVIGIWKYYGGTLNKCVNYGQIQAIGSSPGSAAGMTACFYQMSVTAARIVDCENHGTILSAGTVAGGIASVYTMKPAKLQISGCVNTGLIKNNANCGGIISGSLSVDTSASYIENCRNYGYGVNGSEIAGITNTTVAIRNCFGIADVANPISKANANTSNYYVTASGAAKGTGTRVSVEKLSTAEGYRLVTAADAQVQVGLSGFSIDPLSLTTGNDRYGTGLAVTGGSDNARYRMFLADDAYFVPVITSQEVSSLAAPQNLQVVKGDNQTVSITWSAVTNAEYYEYEIVYLDADNAKLKSVSGVSYRAPSSSVPLLAAAAPEDVTGNVNSMIVRVRAVRTVEKDGQADSIRSDWAEAKLDGMQSILPTPQYHLELEDNNGALKYRIYLDNQEEYRAFLKEHGVAEDKIDEELKRIQINIGINVSSTASRQFTAYAAVSSNLYEGDANATDRAFYAWATSTRTTDPFTSSVKAARESMAPNHAAYTSATKMAIATLQENSASGIGFMGSTPDTLGYRLTIKNSGSYIVYLRSELMATDVALGIPVSVSSSQLRVSNVTTDAIPVMLSGLPEDITDTGHYQKLQVRSYPMMMSNNLVYMGHTVAEGLSEEEMLSYKENGVSVVTGTDASDRRVTEGYVIELAQTAQDGGAVYNIYYNALLEYAARKEAGSYSYPETLSAGAFGFNTQIQYYGINETNISHQKEPEIAVNADYVYQAADGSVAAADGDPNQDRFVIQWDAGFSKAADGKPVFEDSAKYDYVVTGTLADGETTVQIASGSVDSSTQAKELLVSGEAADGTLAAAAIKVNEVVLDASAWNYQTITITVTRRGAVNSKGMTTVFPAEGEKTVSMRKRFSQISRPTLSIVSKDSLIYDLTWSQLPAAELNSGERAGYEVTVRSSDPDGITLRYAPTEEGQEALAAAAEQYHTKLRQTIALYEAKAGQTSAGAGVQSPSVFTWTESFDGAAVTKVMTLSWSEEDLTITKQLKERWIFTVPQEKETVRSLQGRLDLNDFERGESVSISVRALATEQAVVYRDGPDGVEAALAIPERLSVPNVELLQVYGETYLYNEDAFVTLDEFVGSGIALSMTDETQSAAGRYQIAAAVYDERPETDGAGMQALGDMSKVTAGDAPDADGDGVPDAETEEVYWNSGAVKTLLTKQSGTMMDGGLSQAVSRIVGGLDGDYAGKWLKIVLRSTSDNQISSWWSDEDEAEDETVNYRWIRLPRVQTEETGISEEITTVFYTDQAWSLESFDSNESMVSQTTLSMKLSDYAEGYRMQRVRRAQIQYLDAEQEDTYSRYVTDWIYLEPASDDGGAQKADTYAVFCASSEEQFTERIKGEDGNDDASAPVCVQDASAVFVGELAKGGALALPFKENALASDDAEQPEYVNVTAILCWPAEADGEEQSLKLILPDAESVALAGYEPFTDEEKQNYFTLQTSAQAVVLAKSSSAGYADSMITNWYRENVGAKAWVSSVVSMADYMQAPQNLPAEIAVSDYQETAYEGRTSGDYWQVYQVEVLESGEADAAVLDTRYISTYGRGNPAQLLLLLPDWPYLDFQGRYIRLRAADISSNGNIGRWSEAVTAPLPAILPEN